MVSLMREGDPINYDDASNFGMCRESSEISSVSNSQNCPYNQSKRFSDSSNSTFQFSPRLEGHHITQEERDYLSMTHLDNGMSYCYLIIM